MSLWIFAVELKHNGREGFSRRGTEVSQRGTEVLFFCHELHKFARIIFDCTKVSQRGMEVSQRDTEVYLFCHELHELARILKSSLVPELLRLLCWRYQT